MTVLQKQGCKQRGIKTSKMLVTSPTRLNSRVGQFLVSSLSPRNWLFLFFPLRIEYIHLPKEKERKNQFSNSPDFHIDSSKSEIQQPTVCLFPGFPRVAPFLAGQVQGNSHLQQKNKTDGLKPFRKLVSDPLKINATFS